VTVVGAGFGSKNPAKPLIWADFEKDLDPSDLGLKTAWNEVQNVSLSTDCASTTTGTTCGKATNGSGPWTLRVDWNYWTRENQPVYIYRLQRKNFLISDNSQNWKIWRMWISQPGFPNVYAAENNGRVFVEGASAGAETGYWGSFQAKTTGWVSEEFIFRASSAINVKDGMLAMRYNGAQVAAGSLMTRPSANSTYMTRNYVVHGVAANADRWSPAWSSNNRMWVDDVYVDTSWARVLLGDAPVYEDCRRLAPQIPSAWADNSITVRVNLGPLHTVQTRYLYVVDASGRVNSQGYAVSGGTTASAPPSPSSLVVR
jgi:hypothetical protein